MKNSYTPQTIIHHDRLIRYMMLDERKKNSLIMMLLRKQGIEPSGYKDILDIRLKVLKSLCDNYENSR